MAATFRSFLHVLLPIVTLIAGVWRPLSADESPPLESRALAAVAVEMPRLTPRPSSLPGTTVPQVSLDGPRRFHAAPPEGFSSFNANAASGWATIHVPGEWQMQGFEVKTGCAAAYWREFDVPADWKGKSIRLRFDGVQSDCRVGVNGHEAGAHEGGFVPFEINVTDYVAPGKNRVALAVRSETVADMLASATQYAGHQIGGITRKVTLFALPLLHITAQCVTTTFDPHYRNATLRVRVDVANQSGRDASDATVAISLEGANPEPVSIALPLVKAGHAISKGVDLFVSSPRKWDPEHPNLYLLHTTLSAGGAALESLQQRVGFRQVEIRGNQVFVNNCAIKLRGVNRHETHPLLGRSLTPDLWRKDAEIFRAANVNYIRTSHYPPAEEFLDACDELGLFVECEAALCWVQHDANANWKTLDDRDPVYFPYLIRANLENIAANRHHPSVIIWSLANESRSRPLFAEVQRRVAQADPTRLTSFHDQCWGTFNNAGSQSQIANYHYPASDDLAQCDQAARPVLFGEYAHVQTYNDRETFTDPGVRDQWGPRFAEMVDLMYRRQGCLGGAIWAGIDDAFHLPDGQVQGYGFWGIIDGWRRPKPEYFHVKKAYSPVRVAKCELAADGQTIIVPVENRYNFTNLSETRIQWALDGEHGLASADFPPRSTGTLAIALPSKPRDGQTLTLTFADPRGFVCETVALPIRKPVEPANPPSLSPTKLTLDSNANQIEVKGRRLRCTIDRRTGQLCNASVDNTQVLVGGPVLMILPLENCAARDATGKCDTHWQVGLPPNAPLVPTDGVYATQNMGQIDALHH